MCCFKATLSALTIPHPGFIDELLAEPQANSQRTAIMLDRSRELLSSLVPKVRFNDPQVPLY